MSKKTEVFPPPHYVGTRRWWLRKSGGIAVKDQLVAPLLTGDDFIKGGLSGKSDDDLHSENNVEVKCTDGKHCMLGWIDAVLTNTKLVHDGDAYNLEEECVNPSLFNKMRNTLFRAMKKAAPKEVKEELGSLGYIPDGRDIPMLNDADATPRPWLAKVWNDTLRSMGFKLIAKPKGYKCGQTVCDL